MKILEVKFPTKILKAGKAIRVTCARFGFWKRLYNNSSTWIWINSSLFW